MQSTEVYAIGHFTEACFALIDVCTEVEMEHGSADELKRLFTHAKTVSTNEPLAEGTNAHEPSAGSLESATSLETIAAEPQTSEDACALELEQELQRRLVLLYQLMLCAVTLFSEDRRRELGPSERFELEARFFDLKRDLNDLHLEIARRAVDTELAIEQNGFALALAIRAVELESVLTEIKNTEATQLSLLFETPAERRGVEAAHKFLEWLE